MKINKPLLGIAIPSYKRELLLGRLLDSIECKFPIVVSDNGGNLSTQFKKDYSSVIFLTSSEVSAGKNWNRAAQALDTEWIIMPGDDDLYYPESFHLIEKTLQTQPTADIVFFGHNIIDEHDGLISNWRPDAAMLSAPAGFNPIRHGAAGRPPSIAFRSTLFRALGGFDEKFTVTAGDNHFYQRACLVGNTLFSPHIVSGYRVWRDGSTSTTIATCEWMRQIDMWCLSIQNFANLNTSFLYKDSLRDEIYTANLRAGINVLKQKKEYLSAWQHLFSNRYPYRASLRSQVKLLAHLIFPQLK